MKAYLRRIGNIYTIESGEDHIVKNGEVISVEIKKPRNYRFLKKYFTLMNYAFSVWEPEEIEYNGQRAGKNFEVFRDNITVLAGYYDVTIDVNGKIKLIAQSISFANMDEDIFEKLYSKTIDALLKQIFKNYTREDVDNVVLNIIGFDG